VLDRQDQRGRFLAAMDAPAQERTPLLAIVGVPGAGKTSLLRDALARDRDAIQFTARATQLAQEVPFGVLTQLLGELAVREDSADGPFGGPGSVVRDLVLRGETQADFAALVYGLRWVLARASTGSGAIVAVDDIQWIDEPTLRLLTNVVPLTGGHDVRYVIAARAGASKTNPMLMTLAPLTTTFELGAFSLDEVTQLIGDRALNPNEVLAITGGVPFYVDSVIEQYDRGDSGAGRAVAFSVSQRMVDLSNEHVQVAQAVAVLDQNASLAAVHLMTGIEAARLPAMIDDLETAAILTSSPRLDILHPIIAAAIIESMSTSQLEHMHDAAAAALAQAGLPALARAPHVLRGTPSRDAARVDELIVFGNQIAAGASAGDALPYLQAALDEMSATDPRRPHVLTSLAQAAYSAGDLEAAAQTYAALADLHTDAVEIARAHAAEGNALVPLGRHQEAQRRYDEGLTVLEDLDTPEANAVRNETLATMVAAQLNITPLSSRHLEMAFARLAASEGPVSVAEARLIVSLGVGHTLAGQGRQWPIDRLVTEALAAWPRHSTGVADDPTTYMLTGVLNHLDRFDEGVALCDDAIADARNCRHVLSEATAVYCRGALHFAAGRIQLARVDQQSAVGAVPFGWNHYREAAEVLLVRSHIAAGDLAGAREVVDSLSDDDSVGPLLLSTRLLAKSAFATATGDPARGLEFAYAAKDLVPMGAEATGMSWHVEAFEALMAAGDIEAAARLAAEGLATVTSLGAAPRAAACAELRIARASAGSDTAISAARRALELNGPQRALDHAVAKETLAMALLASQGADDRSEARELLTDALTYAREQRLGPMVDRLTRVLSGLGVVVAASTRQQRLASLSSSEYRVAALAASGLSNREIAAKLFVTVKTVEFHLSRSFKKLGIDSRSQLADTLELSQPV